jgi:hypothetical protein
MAVDYSNYRPDISGIHPYAGTNGDVTTGRYGGVSDDYNRQMSRVRTYFKKPRNYNKRLAGLGYVLPNIGGLRLKDITTDQGKRTAIVGGPGNLVYGLAGANARKNLMIGRDASGKITLVRRTATPPAPGTPGTPGSPGTPGAPRTDEFTKYEKDYPWVANYLRSIRDEGNAFNEKYKTDFLPNVTSALNAYANLGTQSADRYARAAATSAAANTAAANIAPTEAAGATGVFDPVALAASQAASRATGQAATENARFAATESALAPATSAQGLLAGIQRGYSAISSEYARKRLDDQMKIEQWIEEQKSAALDRQVQEQYNLGMLNIRGDQLKLDTYKAENEIKNKGQFTGAELIAKGFRPVPTGAGPKSKAQIAAAGVVTATDGGSYYKPRSGGKSGGTGSSVTGNEQSGMWSNLKDAYEGNQRDAQGILTGTSTGFRDLPLQQQIEKITQFVLGQIEIGGVKPTVSAVEQLISVAIPVLQIKQGSRYVNAPQGNTLTWARRIAAQLKTNGSIQ